jgi:vacuolar-type H+-ATPase subunit E/Vma4
MQNAEGEKSSLITGIENDAQVEVEKIVKEAEKQSEERKVYAKKQVDTILKEAEVRADSQYESIKKTILAGAKVEVNRKAMEIRKKITDFIDEQVREQYRGMLKTSEYRKLLLNWIIEAAVGLEKQVVIINSSASERDLIDKTLLTEAKTQIKKISGQDITFKISQQPVLTSQGVVLTADDEKTSFNNQIYNRMRRKQKDIQNLIFEKLFSQQ